MSGIRKKGKGRRKAAKVVANAAVGVTATAVSLQQSESNKKRGRPARVNAAPPPGASRQLLLSPPSLLSPACAVSVSSSLTSSSTPRRKVVLPTDTVTGNDHESSPSKFLCLEQEELKVDLACALEVSAENLVENLTSLLTKLNDTAPSSTAVASATATSPATVETAVAPSAASPVVYSNYTRQDLEILSVPPLAICIASIILCNSNKSSNSIKSCFVDASYLYSIVLFYNSKRSVYSIMVLLKRGAYIQCYDQLSNLLQLSSCCCCCCCCLV